MNHNTIQILFYVSLVLGFGGGTWLFVWWAKRIWKRYYKSATDTTIISPRAVAMKALFFMFPGVILFIIACVPVLYFRSLLKKEDYCKEIIRANKGIKKDDSFIKERCDCLDIDELFENALKEGN